ncbi:MAG: acetyl-CoA carboxylase biotin carboxyl carrier protein subunit [Bacteroidetes bacterium]|nr:MAG: acetyl-CoA carboxylase biotin carboxyl carrier protein subunit [Bacteroidota bacterium]
MSKDNWIIDGERISTIPGANVRWDDDRFFVIEHRGKVFRGEILEERFEDRTLRIKVNHREFVIRKEGSLDALIEELGLNKVKVKKLKQLESPMPGRIVSLAVAIGDEVEVGSELLTLEAMKMENVLKSEGVGKVKSIEVNSDQVVDKGQVLISFE